MKVYFIIALVMFLFCKCDGNNTNTTNADGLDSVGIECEGKTSDSFSNCDKKISDYEKGLDFHCCLLKGKENGAQFSRCIFLYEEEFNFLSDKEKDLEVSNYIESPQIICTEESNKSDNQSAIKFNSFFLLLLFLLFN